MEEQAGGALDDLKKKTTDLLEEIKEKATPENILRVKEVIKQVKEIISNLPLDRVPGLDKVLEKIDKVLELLDPPDEDAGTRQAEVRMIAELVEQHLVPFVEANAEAARRDVGLYAQRLRLVGDYLPLVERSVRRL